MNLLLKQTMFMSRLLSMIMLKSENHLPMTRIAFGTFDSRLLGTHHGVSPKHLQVYVNEYVFQFNQRCLTMASFDNDLGLVI